MLPTTPTILNAYGRPVAEPVPILDAQGNTVIAGRIIPQIEPFSAIPKFEHDANSPSYVSFARYCDWRATKCKPRNMGNPAERLDEANQALHEFIGEVAELGELLYSNHIHAMIVDSARNKMVDEIGDIFFCGCWCLDAFGPNPLREPDAPPPNEMISDERRSDAEVVASRIRKIVDDNDDLTDDEAGRVIQMVSQLSWQMSIFSGLLSNSFKKSVYQQRPQPLEQQIMRVLTVMSIGAHLLVMAGAEPEDALATNIAKLDHRYPNGYEGPGGGNRTGKGAGSELVTA